MIMIRMQGYDVDHGQLKIMSSRVMINHMVTPDPWIQQTLQPVLSWIHDRDTEKESEITMRFSMAKF
eukprot:Awhi_evm1s14753